MTKIGDNLRSEPRGRCDPYLINVCVLNQQAKCCPHDLMADEQTGFVCLCLIKNLPTVLPRGDIEAAIMRTRRQCHVTPFRRDISTSDKLLKLAMPPREAFHQCRIF